MILMLAYAVFIALQAAHIYWSDCTVCRLLGQRSNVSWVNMAAQQRWGYTGNYGKCCITHIHFELVWTV